MFKILSKATGWLADILNPRLSDIFAKRAEALAKTLGPPIFNLTIKIVNHIKEFKDIPGCSADQLIEKWGMAIHYARELEGNWQVTAQGYLTRSYNENGELPSHETTLIIDENIGGLHVFKRLLDRSLKDSEEIQHISIDYADCVNHIKVDEKGIYLDNVHGDWEFDQMLKDAKLRSEYWLERQEKLKRQRDKRRQKAKAVAAA